VLKEAAKLVIGTSGSSYEAEKRHIFNVDKTAQLLPKRVYLHKKEKSTIKTWRRLKISRKEEV